MKNVVGVSTRFDDRRALLSHHGWRQRSSRITEALALISFTHWSMQEMTPSTRALGGPAADLVCIKPYTLTSDPVSSAFMSTVLSRTSVSLHVLFRCPLTSSFLVPRSTRYQRTPSHLPTSSTHSNCTNKRISFY